MSSDTPRFLMVDAPNVPSFTTDKGNEYKVVRVKLLERPSWFYPDVDYKNMVLFGTYNPDTCDVKEFISLATTDTIEKAIEVRKYEERKYTEKEKADLLATMQMLSDKYGTFKITDKDREKIAQL